MELSIKDIEIYNTRHQAYCCHRLQIIYSSLFGLRNHNSKVYRLNIWVHTSVLMYVCNMPHTFYVSFNLEKIRKIQHHNRL